MPKQPSSDISHEPRHLRTLVHEPEYRKAIEKIFDDVQRADEVLDALDFFISRRAEMGMAFKRNTVRFVVGVL